MRPFTLLAPLSVGLILTLAVEGITYQALTRGVYVGITLALAQACGQTINQVVDAELDKLVKPYRPIPSGRVSTFNSILDFRNKLLNNVDEMMDYKGVRGLVIKKFLMLFKF